MKKRILTKKGITKGIALTLMLTVLAGCSGGSSAPTTTAATTSSTQASSETTATTTAETTTVATNSNFDESSFISVISREDGSGTRTAFIELFGVQVKGDDGSVSDMTTKEAIIADKTDVMMTNIASDPSAIGYISLGSMNSTIKALEIDGVAATTDTVKDGTYKIQRPFNIAVKGEASELAQDFMDFILSKEGQDVIVANQYIAIDENAPAYAGSKPAGKIVVGGSSSVTPVMEKLREAYLAMNPEAEIEIQMSDSSAGMTATMNGTHDIGMASRALKESELAELTEISIAIDGLAIIVNNDNPLVGLTTEQVKSIFIGEILNWSEAK